MKKISAPPPSHPLALGTGRSHGHGHQIRSNEVVPGRIHPESHIPGLILRGVRPKSCAARARPPTLPPTTAPAVHPPPIGTEAVLAATGTKFAQTKLFPAVSIPTRTYPVSSRPVSGQSLARHELARRDLRRLAAHRCAREARAGRTLRVPYVPARSQKCFVLYVYDEYRPTRCSEPENRDDAAACSLCPDRIAPAMSPRLGDPCAPVRRTTVPHASRRC